MKTYISIEKKQEIWSSRVILIADTEIMSNNQI